MKSEGLDLREVIFVVLCIIYHEFLKHVFFFLYLDGQGVEKDEKKSIHHTEEAAIGGHPTARCNLAYYEERSGDMKRADKHIWMGYYNIDVALDFYSSFF